MGFVRRQFPFRPPSPPRYLAGGLKRLLKMSGFFLDASGVPDTLGIKKSTKTMLQLSQFQMDLFSDAVYFKFMDGTNPVPKQCLC